MCLSLGIINVLFCSWKACYLRVCHPRPGLQERQRVDSSRQTCLCMFVGFNKGFTGPVSHRLMMGVQRPQNYRVLGCYLS